MAGPHLCHTPARPIAAHGGGQRGKAAHDHGQDRCPIRCAQTAALALLLMSCAPSGSYTPPTFPFLPGYHGAVQGLSVLLQNDDWWLRLNDPVLNWLIATALAGNPTLAVARARVNGADTAFNGTPGLINLTTPPLSPDRGFTVYRPPDPAPPSRRLAGCWTLTAPTVHKRARSKRGLRWHRPN